MKIKTKTSYIDSKDNKSYQYGNVYEIGDSRAKELISLGLAEEYKGKEDENKVLEKKPAKRKTKKKVTEEVEDKK